MKKNKILSILAVFIMIFAFIPMTSGVIAEEEKTNHQIAIDTVVGIGLMNGDSDGNFLSDSQVTRGELASIIAKMFITDDNSLVEWKTMYYKEYNEAFVTTDSFSTTAELFSDVDSSSEDYNAIKIVNDLGIMTGYTDGSFGPENQLTYEQAIKVIITMLGYGVKAELYGGFPTGYIRMANDLKLLNGLSQTTGTITKGDIALLIYNTLDVKMFDIVSIGNNIEYSAQNTDSFLTRFLGMRKITGRVTDNGYSNFLGEQIVAKDFMIIGGINVRVEAEKSYARGFLGRTVNAYVTDNKGDYTLVYAGLDGLDNVVTIDIKDYKSYEKGKITYKNGEHTKTVSFETNASIIYNGSGCRFDSNIFKFSIGTISVVTPKGANKADILIVEAYESYYVDYVDYANKAVYSKKVLNGVYASDKINLNRDENYYLVVKKSDGTPSDITEIKNECVVSVAEGRNSMTVIVSNEVIKNFVVNEKKEIEGKIYVLDGKNAYPLSKRFVNDSEGKGIEGVVVGETYTAYIDIFGEAVCFKLASMITDKCTVAVVINSMKTTGLDPLAAIKVINSDGTIEEYNIASKITVSGNKNLSDSINDKKTMTEIEFFTNYIDGYHGIVRFTVNAENEINYLEFPIKQVTFGNNPDNRLAEIYIPDTDGATEGDYRDLYFDPDSSLPIGWYYKPNQGFAGQILIKGANSKVFVCPKKPANDASDTEKNNYNQQVVNEEYYQISTPDENFVDDKKYILKAYTITANSKYAQFIVNYREPAQSTINHGTRVFHVFNKSYQGVDGNGMPCTYISFYTNASEQKIALSEECINTSGDIKVESIMNPGVAISGLQLEKGDIFRYATDENGKIQTLQIIVDESAYNPAAADENNKVGNLYSTDGKWHANFSLGTTNPYGVVTDLTTGTNTFYERGRYWSDGGNGYMRNALYWVLYTIGNDEICLTTQPLGADGEKFELDELGEVFVTDFYALTTVDAITIEANGVTVKSIPITQLKTYELTGNNCDRIFLSSRVGAPTNIYAYINYSKDLSN